MFFVFMLWGMLLCVQLINAQAAAPIQLAPIIIYGEKFRPPQSPLQISPVAVASTRLNTPDLLEKQTPYLADVLQNMPGIHGVQSGGKGHVTTFFVRGLGDQIQVRIDGMRANNPATINGTYDLSHFTLEGVQDVTVLRGPVGTLYGADAFAGVLEVTTPKGAGALEKTVHIEGGHSHTYRGGGKIQGQQGRLNYHVAMGQGYTRGYTSAYTGGGNKAAASLSQSPGGRKTDPYHHRHMNGRFGVDVNDHLAFSLFTRIIDTNLGYSSSNPQKPSPMNQSVQAIFNRLQMNQTAVDGKSAQEIAVSFVHLQEMDQDVTGLQNKDRRRGQRFQLDWGQTIDFSTASSLNLRFNHEWEGMKTNITKEAVGNDIGQIQKNRHITGGAIHHRWSPMPWILFEMGARIDHISPSLTPLTYRISCEFYPIAQTKNTTILASWGTAYKAPTLSQLFVDNIYIAANPRLKPESGQGWEGGIQQTWFQGRFYQIQSGLIYFRQDIHHMIAPDDTFSIWMNIHQVRTDGVEFFIKFIPISDVTVRFDYTYLRAINRQTGVRLLRRPQHKATASLRYQMTEKLLLSCDITGVGRQVDVHPQTFQRTMNRGYITANARVQYQLREGVHLFGRVENGLNGRHENPLGYVQPGFALYCGMRGVF